MNNIGKTYDPIAGANTVDRCMVNNTQRHLGVERDNMARHTSFAHLHRMLFQRLLPQSLKSRVTLLTIFIVVCGFLTLSSYVKGLLRDELISYTGAQQRSALKLLGAEVSRDCTTDWNR